MTQRSGAYRALARHLASVRICRLVSEDDHIHLLVNYPPKVSVSNLVNSLKGVSSRMIRKKNYPSIRKKLWGGALWSPSYFAGSCGGASIAVIRQYIEQQQTPH